MRRSGAWRQLWQVAPIGVVVGIGVVTDFLALGITGVKWLNYVWVTLGWVAGWWLVEADKYVVRVKGMEKYMAEWSRAIRNVLTALVLAVVGLWVTSSSSSLLAAGLVFGLAVRLFSEFIYTNDWRSWYWVVAREISDREHKVFMVIFGIILLLDWLLLVRG